MNRSSESTSKFFNTCGCISKFIVFWECQSLGFQSWKMGHNFFVVFFQFKPMVLWSYFDVVFVVDPCENGSMSVVMNGSSIWITVVASCLFKYCSIFFRNKPSILSIPDHLGLVLNHFSVIPVISVKMMLGFNWLKMVKRFFDFGSNSFEFFNVVQSQSMSNTFNVSANSNSCWPNQFIFFFWKRFDLKLGAIMVEIVTQLKMRIEFFEQRMIQWFPFVKSIDWGDKNSNDIWNDCSWQNNSVNSISIFVLLM